MRQSFTRDVRTPADPQDFESLYDRPARPPRDFRVKLDSTGAFLVFDFQDYSGIVERDPTVEYRAYYVPATIGTAAEMGNTKHRLAAFRLGRMCASTPASGKGEWISVPNSNYNFTFTKETGWFLACGVNRRGVESEPTLAFLCPLFPH